MHEHVRMSMSSLFIVSLRGLVKVHSFKPHSASVISIYSNSTLPNDVMSRQGLVDRSGGTCLSMSSLFIVTVHSFKPNPASVIAINSNSRLPNDVMSRQGLIDKCGGTCSDLFKGRGGLAQTCLGYMLLLFIVTVHCFKQHPA